MKFGFFNLRLLRVEALKLRRSLALLMLFACPFMVSLLVFGVQMKTGAVGKPVPLTMYWLAHTAIWTYFMLPLMIALLTALVNGQEHKNATWRIMLSQPISARQLFFAKFVLAAIMVLIANGLLMLMMMGGANVLEWFGRNVQGQWQATMLQQVLILSLASLPILIIQLWLSWHVQNMVAPLALGVIATMGILQIGQSKDWIYYPWSYVMAALQASAPEVRQSALQLASLLAAVLLTIALAWVGRRGAEFK